MNDDDTLPTSANLSLSESAPEADSPAAEGDSPEVETHDKPAPVDADPVAKEQDRVPETAEEAEPVTKAKSRSKVKEVHDEEGESEGVIDSPERDEPSDESLENAAAPEVEPAPVSKRHWYVIKVTSNREESIKSAIERRVRIEGLEEFVGDIVIPVERITQVKKVVEKKKDTGEKVTKEKRVTKENKKFPGYLFAEVEFNDRVLYLFRETNGVGDFVGASLNRAPTPMTDKEVQAMLHGIVDPKDKKGGKTVIKVDYEKGDKVRIREGAFANSEGEVKFITDPKDSGDSPKVTVVVTIWGRPVDVELDYWQVDKI